MRGGFRGGSKYEDRTEPPVYYYLAYLVLFAPAIAIWLLAWWLK